MSNLFSTPTSLLRKTIVVRFDGEDTEGYVQAVDPDSHMEVIFNPDMGDDEFYAELYFDDFPDWYIVEIKD